MHLGMDTPTHTHTIHRNASTEIDTKRTHTHSQKPEKQTFKKEIQTFNKIRPRREVCSSVNMSCISNGRIQFMAKSKCDGKGKTDCVQSCSGNEFLNLESAKY